MLNFIEIGGGSRKFSKKLVDLTRNDPDIFTWFIKYFCIIDVFMCNERLAFWKQHAKVLAD